MKDEMWLLRKLFVQLFERLSTSNGESLRCDSSTTGDTNVELHWPRSGKARCRRPVEGPGSPATSSVSLCPGIVARAPGAQSVAHLRVPRRDASKVPN